MVVLVPRVAQGRLKALHEDYLASRVALMSFVSGLLLGMGLDPDTWALATTTMILSSQEGQTVESLMEANRNGTSDKR